MRYILIILIAIGLIASLFACASEPTQSTTSSSSTFGSLAQSGQTIFAAKCASCHGANGQGIRGPALWGTDAHYSALNGKDLLDIISTTMPPNAPGSLTHQEYLNVLSYLLVQNNFVETTVKFDESQLNGISLK